ncbi:MAG: polyprenyl synthetase family protein [Candidatus Hodarchaeales archaeon]|jgi:geranylgeranyl diphosphate synthase type I
MINNDLLDLITKLGKKIEEPMYSLLEKHVHEDFRPVVIYQAKTGGKRIRPALTLLFSQATGRSSEEEVIYGAIGVELIHNYSLIVDDIIDQGILRRGLETVRAKFSNEMALLSSMIYREAIYDSAKLCGNPKSVLEIYSRTIRELVEGERLDIILEQKQDHEYYDTHKIDPKELTEDLYLHMINKKTGILFSCASEVGVILGGGSKKQIDAAKNFGTLSGLAFQIVDDILDLKGEEKRFGKEIGKDIKEGKLSNYPLLVSYNIMNKTDQNFILDVLKSHNPTSKQIETCLQLVEEANGFSKAKEKALDYISEAKSQLDNIFPNEEAIEAIKASADFIVNRYI